MRNQYNYEKKFTQIVGATGELYALDEGGNVWRYYPESEVNGRIKWAYWGMITGYRAKPNIRGPGKTLSPEEGGYHRPMGDAHGTET